MNRYLHLHVLGAKAAAPSSNENTSSFVLESDQHFFLIDCGEGTQRELRRRKVKFSRIHHIFISHLHGDHVFGLPGFLTSLSLLGRVLPMTIIGPRGIRAFVQQILALSYSKLSYNIHYIEVDTSIEKLSVVLEDKTHVVRTFPLSHRVPTIGYRIDQKPLKRKLKVDKINQEELPVQYYKELTEGKDVQYNGKLYRSEQYTSEGKRALSFAYCSDTAFKPDISGYIHRVDLLYHEATYLNHRRDMAQRTGHSTAEQAAQVAKLSEVGKLVIGHLSSRIKDRSEAEKQAQTIFEKTNVYSTKTGHRIEL